MKTTTAEFAKKTIYAFNKINSMKYRPSSWEEHIEELREMYDDETIMMIVENNPASSPSAILNPQFIDLWLANRRANAEFTQQVKTLKAEIEEQKNAAPAPAPTADQSNLTLGLIEKALAKVIAEEYAPAIAENVFESAMKRVEEVYGPLQKKVEYVMPQTGGSVCETTHEEFETVLAFVAADEPVMLIGPAGTGKNVICKQVAQAMNIDFYFSNAVTQEYKLTGFIDANGNYHETEFYKAFKNGGLFMLDEIDASIPEVLVILNAAIANRYFDFPNGKIEAHENFRIIAAGNTYGTGADYQYVGRNQLDAASLDRFAQVEIGYSEAIENSLTQDRALLTFARRFRNAIQQNGLQHTVSYRTITRLEKMGGVIGKEKAIKTCLTKSLETADLNMLRSDLQGLVQNEWAEAFLNLLDK